jgi:hypothetical protein
MSPNKAAGIATLVLLLSALLVADSLSRSDFGPAIRAILVMALGSLAAGLLYGLAWGWKGLAMCIAIAFTYTAAAFVEIVLRPPRFVGRDAVPEPRFSEGDAAFLAGLGGISLLLALIGGVVGAVLRGVVGAILHRRHKRPR